MKQEKWNKVLIVSVGDSEETFPVPLRKPVVVEIKLTELPEWLPGGEEIRVPINIHWVLIQLDGDKILVSS